MANYAAFLWFAFVAAVTPGPNNVMALAIGGKFGIRQGVKFAVGVGLGVMAAGGLCVIFSAGLIHFIPKIEQAMRYIGFGYILWLAFKLVTAQPEQEGTAAVKQGGVMDGALLQFVNPKMYLYVISTYSLFIFPHYTQISIWIVSLAILAVLGTVTTSGWAVFGSVFQRFYKSHFKAVNIVMALMLVYCAVSLFL